MRRIDWNGPLTAPPSRRAPVAWVLPRFRYILGAYDIPPDLVGWFPDTPTL